jgi:hypothetical protein
MCWCPKIRRHKNSKNSPLSPLRRHGVRPSPPHLLHRQPLPRGTLRLNRLSHHLRQTANDKARRETLVGRRPPTSSCCRRSSSSLSAHIVQAVGQSAMIHALGLTAHHVRELGTPRVHMGVHRCVLRWSVYGRTARAKRRYNVWRCESHLSTTVTPLRWQFRQPPFLCGLGPGRRSREATMIAIA